MKNNKILRLKKKKRGKVVTAHKSSEVRYRRQLNKLVVSLRKDVATQIVPLLRKLEPEYVNDSYAATLEQAFNNLRMQYANINTLGKSVASTFAEGTAQNNKQRFYQGVDDVIGVNLSSVVQNEGLGDILTATTRENVSLIRSIPEEYFKSIETIVFSGTVQGNNATSMIKDIMSTGRSTQKRAKLIARDQTSKLNSALNQQRQQNLGVTEYIWRTAEDGRVRDSHRSKNGKIFKWNDPPKDTGHPGQDIQCRCVAQPIINV